MKLLVTHDIDASMEKNWFDELVEIWEQEVKDMEGCGEAYLRALEFLEMVKNG